MSESAPERTGGGGSLFTQKIGPLPMWGWIAAAGGGLIAWRVYSGRKAASTAASDTGSSSVPASDVPEFVNQTYTTVVPPSSGPPKPTPTPTPVPRQPTPKQRLRRTWTAPVGGVSTLAEIAQRLTGRADPALLTPANPIAQKFITGPFKRSKNAKVPKGAEFTYLEGSVVNV